MTNIILFPNRKPLATTVPPEDRNEIVDECIALAYQLSKTREELVSLQIELVKNARNIIAQNPEMR